MIKKEIREMEQALATAPSEDRGYYEYWIECRTYSKPSYELHNSQKSS